MHTILIKTQFKLHKTSLTDRNIETCLMYKTNKTKLHTDVQHTQQKSPTDTQQSSKRTKRIWTILHTLLQMQIIQMNRFLHYEHTT